MRAAENEDIAQSAASMECKKNAMREQQLFVSPSSHRLASLTQITQGQVRIHKPSGWKLKLEPEFHGDLGH